MSRSDHRIGKWAAILIVVISALYIATGAIWLISNFDTAMKVGLQPSEPYLSILEILILISTAAILPLFAALYSIASNDKKTHGLSAFGFALLMIAMTGAVHAINLMVIRRTASANVAEVFTLYTADGRLSTLLALDLLGWDFFFGFAMLFEAFVFKGDKLQNAIRGCLILGGSLCLIGFYGPVSGDLRFQLPAILGYAFVFPFVCLLLAIFFVRSDLLQTERLDKFAGEKLN